MVATLAKPKNKKQPKIDENELVASICKDSFFDFVKEFWDEVVPETPIWNWHIEYLCNELQYMAERVFIGESKEYDLIVNIPPGTTKSTICSIMFPAWVWTRMASARCLCGSYSYPLALELSRKCRKVVQSEKYQACFPEVEIEDDQNTKGNYVNSKGGCRYAFGVGGSVTGMHGHFILIDDPLDPNRAASDIELKKTNTWIGETLSQRKVDKRVTPLMLIMQRLHQIDPAGDRLEKSAAGKAGKVKHICLPAEDSDDVKPEYLRKFYVNGLLDPVRLSREVLKEAHETLLDYGYSCQFRQHPIPRGGGMFKTDRLKPGIPPKKFKKLCRFWDKAATSKGGTYTVGALMGIDLDENIWILDIIRGQWDSGEREKIIQRTAKFDGKIVLIGIEQEGAGGGKESAESSVRKLMGYRTRVIRPSTDKELRADPFSQQVNSGNVYYKEASWNADLFTEMIFFPYSKYKDQVDGLSGAFTILTTKIFRAGAL